MFDPVNSGLMMHPFNCSTSHDGIETGEITHEALHYLIIGDRSISGQSKATTTYAFNAVEKKMPSIGSKMVARKVASDDFQNSTF